MVAHRIRETDVEEETRMAFRLFDKEGTGYVSTHEIRHLMSQLGEKLTTQQDLVEMLDRADVEEAGQVRYETFIKKIMFPEKKKQVQFQKGDTVFDEENWCSGALPGGSSTYCGHISRGAYHVVTEVDSRVCTDNIEDDIGYC